MVTAAASVTLPMTPLCSCKNSIPWNYNYDQAQCVCHCVICHFMIAVVLPDFVHQGLIVYITLRVCHTAGGGYTDVVIHVRIDSSVVFPYLPRILHLG